MFKTLLAEAAEDDDLFFSNSSTDEEEIDAVGYILSETIRSRHSIQNYLDIVRGYNVEEFMSHFRISPDIFNDLCQDFSNSDVFEKLRSKCCTDGSHIKINKPKERDCDYFNQKQYYSLNIQAVCNEDKKFIDVCIGYLGSIHDSRVLENSSLYGKLQQLCRNDKYIIGDSAYPLKTSLMVPDNDNGHLSPAQIKFNKKLSSCRVFIEHSFGILKERFPQLHHVRLRGHKRICHFIRACMVLHNIATDYGFENFNTVAVDAEDQPHNICEDEVENAAVALRNQICACLS